jgi:hypothetical protein
LGGGGGAFETALAFGSKRDTGGNPQVDFDLGIKRDLGRIVAHGTHKLTMIMRKMSILVSHTL